MRPQEGRAAGSPGGLACFPWSAHMSNPPPSLWEAQDEAGSDSGSTRLHPGG